MKKSLILSIVTSAMLVMTGCGSSDDSDDGSDTGGSDTTVQLTSQFIDTTVSGLYYNCTPSNNSGITNSIGKFDYVDGDTCTFKVGDLSLGSAKPNNAIFTPRFLNSDPLVVTNILRLLQTLDYNEDLSDGISLSSTLTGTLDLGVKFEDEIGPYLASNNNTNVLVSAVDAEAHFDSSVPELILTDAFFKGKTFDVPNVVIQFHATENTFIMNGDGSVNQPGTWEIVGNNLEITPDGEVVVVTSTLYVDSTIKTVADVDNIIVGPYTATYTDGSVKTSINDINNGNYLLIVDRVVPTNSQGNENGVQLYYCEGNTYKQVDSSGSAYGTYALDTTTNSWTTHITSPVNMIATFNDDDGYFSVNETADITVTGGADVLLTVREIYSTSLPSSVCTAP